MFNIKVNGEVVHSIEEGRVLNLAVMSSKGSIGEAAIDPSQGEVNIILTMADPRDVHLVDLQASRVPANVSAEAEAEAFPEVVPNTASDILTGDVTTTNEGITPALDPNAEPGDAPAGEVTEESDKPAPPKVDTSSKSSKTEKSLSK